jgi:hypothetical protein
VSVNDRDDDKPVHYLTFDEFVRLLCRTGWRKENAIAEWRKIDKPVTIDDLEW